MKRRTISLTLALLAGLLMSLPATAQNARIDISRIDYSATAAETVEVTLDGPLLRMAAKFMRKEDPGDRDIADMIENLEGIYVKSFTFDEPGMWSAGDIDLVRSQIGPMWQRVVNVRGRDGENVEIYMLPTAGDDLAGIVIVATEDDELTVVNLVGPVDLAKLSSLENQFGIPEMGLEDQKVEKGVN